METRVPQTCKVYTPDELATAIVQSLGDKPSARWLEPSHGDGAFLRALAQSRIEKDRIVAIDLDCNQVPSDRLARTKRGIDFLDWSARTRLRFDRIVGNPPYVSIRRLQPSLRSIAANVLDCDAKPIGVSGNLWQAFVFASLRVLAPGGSLALILPSAAEYANYSVRLRAAIREKFEVVELLRCRKPLFDGVQEGTVVAIARGYGSGPCRFRRREFDTREKLIAALNQRGEVRQTRCPIKCVTPRLTGIEFGEVATIRLGGVTGDARYFLLTDAQRHAAKLPESACTPVVTRSRHVRAAFIDDVRWHRLRAADERVWLFNPPDREVEHGAVQRRLLLKESEGGCRRSAYKISIRDLWYRTPMPPSPHGFISGMQSAGPWITMNKMSGLNATNTLYVVQFAEELSEEERFSIALCFFSSKVQRQLNRSVRLYADGLCKYEPGSLLKLRIPEYRNHAPNAKDRYIQAVAAMLSGDLSAARKIAEEH